MTHLGFFFVTPVRLLVVSVTSAVWSVEIIFTSLLSWCEMSSMSWFLRKVTSPFFNFFASSIMSFGNPRFTLIVPETLINFCNNSFDGHYCNNCLGTSGNPSLHKARIENPPFQSKIHIYHHKSASYKYIQLNFHKPSVPICRTL